MSTYQAHISKFTSDIVVNGKNKIDVSITFTDKKSGDYDSEIYIELGKRYFYKYFTSTSPQTVSFTIPVDWLSEIPDSSKGTGKIKLQCININTAKTEYEEIKNFTVFVPEEYKPDISNLSIYFADIKYGMVDYLAYGLTKPVANALVTPHPTSPIKKWYLTGGGVTASGDEISYVSGNDYNFSVVGELVRALSNTNFTLTVEDGRKRTASITSEAFYIQAYNRPIVNSLSAYRTDKDGITKADGGYIKVTVDSAASPIRDSEGNEINTLDCYLSWKKTTESSYSHFEPMTNKEPFIFEADKDLNFEIKCTIRDKYMETTAYANVTGDSKDFNIVDGGGGVAIGTKATKGYFDVAYNSRFQKGLSANGEISSKTGLVSTGTGSKGDFLSFGEATSIAAYQTPGGFWYGDDLNDYTSIGLYGVYSEDVIAPSAPNGAVIYNIPISKPGTLRVYNATGNTSPYATEKYLMQEYVVYDGSATYRRCFSKIRDSSDVEWPENWTYGSWQCFSGVEEGTLGIWKYRKCGSGFVECWAREVKINAAKDDNQTVKPYNFIALPFPIALATRQCMITFTGNAWKLKSAYDRWYSGDDNQLCILCYSVPEVGTATDQYINIYVTGYCK